MANVDKTGTPTVTTGAPPHNCRITGLYAGEALAAFDAVYIKASDGLVYKADASADDEGAVVAGFAAAASSSGEAVTIIWDVVCSYGANISGTLKDPGTLLYLSATAGSGKLADAAGTGSPHPIAQVIDAAGRLLVWRTRTKNADAT